jgi:hypothetical protein
LTTKLAERMARTATDGQVVDGAKWIRGDMDGGRRIGRASNGREPGDSLGESGTHMWKQNASTFLKNVQKGGDDECWPWIGKPNGYRWKYGYAKCRMNRKRQFVHRVAYQLFVGPIPDDKPIIRHTCDNPRCVNPNHLIAGTVQDNIDDRNLRNRQAKGDGNGRSKLTAEQVEEIRKLYVPYRTTFKSLAERYGVTLDQIHRIVRRKSWR